MDKVIDRLSFKLTKESRERCFVDLGIPHEDIIRAQEEHKALKNQATTLLKKWHDEHLQKYWKYQDILTVLRTMEKNDKADDIIKEYKILGTLLYFVSIINKVHWFTIFRWAIAVEN